MKNHAHLFFGKGQLIIKTLYISDLDGTLMNENAELSKNTESILNELIEKGMYFTAATARTQATAVKILQNVNITLPAILMNGVILFDLKAKKCVKTEYISKKGKLRLIEAVEKYLKSGFLYAENDSVLSVYYMNTHTPNAEKFIEERVKKYDKKFTLINSFREKLDDNLVYYSIEDKKENLEKAYEFLKDCPELNVEFYRDIYENDCWYLEVSSEKASKFNALMSVKKMFGFERVVCFGDNLNDLPLFNGSDEAYAMENAKDAVKAKADKVIGKNTEDGVAEYLKKHFKP